MKKNFITIIIFLFTATTISQAQFFRQSESESTGSNSNVYENYTNGSENETSDENGGFFRSSNEKPGGRPESGGGIGQNSPLGEELYFWLASCIVFIFLKKIKPKMIKETIKS